MKTKPHDQMVANVLRTYSDRTMLDEYLGETWYEEAHGEAQALSRVHGFKYSAVQTAGVIAAVSPQNRWTQNLRLAVSITQQHADGQPLSGYLGDGLRKAQRILDDEDPWAVLTSQKVRAFYDCIISNGQTDTVCVDRHAASIAYGGAIKGNELRFTPKQYSNYAAAYADAATQLGMPAAVLQAITWVTWRRERGIA